MNIHEYQAKEILKSFGIPVPNGCMVKSVRQAEKSVEKFGCLCVLKAQIYAGGRGKAGGIKTVQDAGQACDVAKELLKKKLVTIQTGTHGLAVKRILVEETIAIEKEFYLSITLDRRTSRYCLIASAQGGIDIEEVARTSPEKIHTLYIDPFIGVRDYHARRIALSLGLKGRLIEDCIKLVQNLYKLLLEKDCSLVEINPLVISKDQRLIAMDCKINFDDNALFRHPDYEKMIDDSQLDSLEIQAKKYDLAYIKLNGNIGCMVNGAGLAMATLDVLKEYGGEPANFLDVGGGANREKVAEAFKIILKDKKVKGIFVNIFGGIMHCDIIAQGIIDATKQISCELPIVVRMDGSRLSEGKSLLSQSGLNVETVDTLADGVAKIVQRMGKKRKVIAN
ncbi:MAG: succinate--CoA ligase subunit beta [Deltaproteobacteria bacterium RBG_16_44_11]|nr:MAG: succinate--CoA ligase subunit beta [Deltaproteobacteria bacterium RBG_16_44_11]